MKLSVIAKAIDATLYGADGDLPQIAIDSRKITGGELFIALKGENFDGHDYIESALQKGAKVVIAAHEPRTPLEKSVTFLKVKDTTVALGKLGAFWRARFSLSTVGITGSCGKTTVKGMMESICEQQGKTLATKGNFNNHIGLPLTLLRLDETYQYGVIEMGASGIGEIRYLGNIAKPNVSLITNVMPAHLLGFGSIEGVAKAKSEIYDILPHDGIAVLNVDEKFSDFFRTLIKDRKVITYGLRNKSDVTATNIEMLPFAVRFDLQLGKEQQNVIINIPGEHTIMNALAASAAGLAMGISLENIVKGLSVFDGVPGRLRRIKGKNGAILIDDSYNANPGSMNAALDVLGHCQGKKVFVMGDMAELGEDAVLYHEQIGQRAKEKGVQSLFAVGKLSQHAVKAFGEGAKMYPDKTLLVDELKDQLTQETIVLIKGSRSSGMEAVTNALAHHEES
ncbi:MAG: UDP-N-acetylmuramoyl-tripeptide--D-alanyl-D-alanine ligase [Candidatus Berkiella sp.]